MIHLSFFEKNKLRKYPFRSSASLRSTSGFVLPNDFIIGLKLTVPSGYHDIFVSKVLRRDKKVVIDFNRGTEAIGQAFGEVTGEDTRLTITGLIRGVTGTILIGKLPTTLASNNILEFLEAATLVEPSVATYINPPGVSSLYDRYGTSITGFVTTSGVTGVGKENAGNAINFYATNSASLESLGDIHSVLDNCATPVIRKVNTATPLIETQVEGQNEYIGNLFLIGLSPIEFFTETEDYLQVRTPDYTYTDLCTSRAKTLPPIVPDYIDPALELEYYVKNDINPRSILTADKPEFLRWPQYSSRISVTSTEAEALKSTFTITSEDISWPPVPNELDVPEIVLICVVLDYVSPKATAPEIEVTTAVEFAGLDVTWNFMEAEGAAGRIKYVLTPYKKKEDGAKTREPAYPVLTKAEMDEEGLVIVDSSAYLEGATATLIYAKK